MWLIELIDSEKLKNNKDSLIENREVRKPYSVALLETYFSDFGNGINTC